MSTWGVKTTDDRGRKVPLLRAFRSAFIPTAEVRAMPEEIRGRVLASQRVPGIIAVAIGWAFGIALCTGFFGTMSRSGSQFIRSISGPLAVMLGVTLFVLVMWFIAWIGFVANRLIRHAAIADRILSLGRCASCGHDLGGLIPADDGCVTCPECAAAWRADRTRPPQPVVATIGPELWSES
ncbi:MAG TPA: hypothetical protein VG797_09050 [Phycisphaerales bacterium]|nr:hypothetical protein [Phycisphaerales bacterium]